MSADLSDVAFAGFLAEAAGAALLEVRAGSLEGGELKGEGDRRAQEVLAALLAEHRPADAVLSEEAADSAARLSADRVWIIDPLDGTREFSERPRTDWAVHIALWQSGDLVAGAVALPARGAIYLSNPPPAVPATPASTTPASTTPASTTPASTTPASTTPASTTPASTTPASTTPAPAPGEPATRGSGAAGGSPEVREPAASGVPNHIRLAVSRSRPPAFVTAVAELLGATLVPMGSAGVKCASVWLGETDAYVHGGGQYEWDSAAPVAVARAAGLHTSRIDGSPLEYNRADPLLPDLVVCRPELADVVLKAIAEVNS